MSDDEIIKYPGKDLDVYWNGKLCIHIGECSRAKGELFINGRQPWCQPDLASNEEVKEVVLRCPTGALTYQHKDGAKSEQVAPENTIHVAYNGPLYFKGDLDIEGVPDEHSAVVDNQKINHFAITVTKIQVSGTAVPSARPVSDWKPMADN